MSDVQSIVWYKRTGGKVFLGFLFTFIAILVAFACLVGYYLYQIKYNKKEFNFTTNKSVASQIFVSKITEDINKYVHPDDFVSGSADAPVIVVAFMDFDCMVSRQAFPAFWQMHENYAPVAKIVYKNIALNGIDSVGYKAALAEACAREQNKGEDYWQALFLLEKWEDDVPMAVAKSLGLNLASFQSCLTSGRHVAELTRNGQDALALGLRGTPTFIVNKQKVEGAPTMEEWNKILMAEIK